MNERKHQDGDDDGEDEPCYSSQTWKSGVWGTPPDAHASEHEKSQLRRSESEHDEREDSA